MELADTNHPPRVEIIPKARFVHANSFFVCGKSNH